VWCFTPIILALRILNQEDQEFEACFGYKVRMCLKNKQIITKQQQQVLLQSINPLGPIVVLENTAIMLWTSPPKWITPSI
jgi:hypothetical protein